MMNHVMTEKVHYQNYLRLLRHLKMSGRVPRTGQSEISNRYPGPDSSLVRGALIIVSQIKIFRLQLRKMTKNLSRNIYRRLEIRIISILGIIRYLNVPSLQKMKK